MAEKFDLGDRKIKLTYSLRKINRCIFSALIAVCICVLVGCSKIFLVKPSGKLSGTVRFDFYEGEAAANPSEFKIVEFVIQKQIDNGGWVTSWELAGKRSLSSIEYGVRYDGLNVMVEPEPLASNTNYRVLVAEVSAVGPKGFAGSEFYFSDSGEMVVKK